MDKSLMNEYKKLGLNISYYRKLAGKSQEQVADAVDISYTHMSTIETASGAPSLDVLFKMARFLNVPIHKLFEFRD